MESIKRINLGGGYILAVEDSLVQAKKLEFLLRKNSIRFVLCSNAEEAYRVAVNNPPVLIISDIVMPGMNGYEFCTKVKSTPQLADIPVILLTSLQDSEDIIKGLQAGADNFISKPYEEVFLIKQIDYLLQNRESDSNTGEVVKLRIQDKVFEINSGKKQILDLLLSVYEAAIQRNNELIAIKAQLENANESLNQANRELEAFAHTVSHDLKSPLSGIIGFSNLLMTNSRCKKCEDEYSYMQLINESAWSMSHLITDLLNFAKSGMVEINKEEVDLSSLAHEVMSVILKRDSQRNVKVSIAPDLTAQADFSLIRIVFDNLLGNAFKYSANVEEANIIFNKMDYYGHDLFFVKDNGAGFNMAHADKLFQPFERLHSASEFTGTGVGLSTVKKIIERHGGRVWAESEVGKGTTIYFMLDA